jgi:putative ABC transport system permease protein
MLKLALRNILRHKTRTGMTLAAIVTGVAALVLSGGFVRDIFAQLAEAVVHSQYGHVQLARAGYFREGSRRPDEFVLANPESLKSRVASVAGVVDAMGRLSFAGLLNNGRTDLAVIGEGIEPGREAKLGSYVIIAAGRQLADGDAFGALLGQGVAQSLKLVPGDRATLVVSTPEGAMNTLDLEVVGVFQSFSKEYDARAVKIPLAAAQELLGTRGANVLVVSLARTSDTARVATALEASLGPEKIEVKKWNELSDFYDKTVELYQRQFGVLRLIVLAMVLLSVANSVNMSVFERVGEFGTMRALGNRGSGVFRLIVTESAVLGAAGGLLGMVVGIVLAIVISKIGIPMPPPPNSELAYMARIRVEAADLGTAFMVGFAATLLASILPALRVSRMDVVHALRANT